MHNASPAFTAMPSAKANVPLAKRIQRLNASPLRALFSAVKSDSVISFAGGLPAAETFPDLAFQTPKSSYMQYGASEGEPALREHIAKQLKHRGLKTDAERVLILSGSQQGIDLVAKLLIEKDTQVAIETPTYLAALQVFDLFGASTIGFEPAEPETAFANRAPSLLYCVPTFQNPSGYSYTIAERISLAELCQHHGTVLFEDDPYRDLAYEPCNRTPVCAHITDTDWIYQSSFSKTIAPGLRIGYLTCSESLFPHLLHLKQAADLHSCRLSQQLLIQQLEQQDTAERSRFLVNEYRQKRDYFQQMLIRHFNDLADWQLPKGGLFFWLCLKPHIRLSTTTLFHHALEQGVAFMPGEYFYNKEHARHNAMRLNFSNASSSDVETGLGIVADLIRQAKP